MKRLFTLSLLTLFLGITGFSQNYINYDRDSRIFLGINGGGTWHTQTESDYQIRGGWGFTFGSSIGMQPKKMFSWDWRFRFLHGYWGGQSTQQYNLDANSTVGLQNYPSEVLNNYQDSLGYFIPNFKNEQVEFSLELVLNTNRLRENTGWNFYIFGGIGATGYSNQADLLSGNSSSSIYDYANLGSLNKPNLMSFQDNDYETNLLQNGDEFAWNWMPSFGAGISYQVTPWFAMGLEHKMTWTRTNLWDGLQNDPGTGTASSSNDIYHYSGVTMKFHLWGGGHSDIEYTDVDSFDTTDPNPVVNNVNPPARQKPIVDIYDPGVNPYETEYSQFTILANIYYVDGKQNITFKQNGIINNNFTYNPNTEQFTSNVVLKPGQNLFEITGVNNAGSDYESTIIIYKLPELQPEPPIVTITNPPYSPYTTDNNIFSFAATVLNVDSKSDINMYVNGQYFSNFTYNVNSKVLNATLNLMEGTNTVTVTASNKAGSDSKTATIIYKKPEAQQPPVVSFINPSVDPAYTNTPGYNVTAQVLNVDSKNDCEVRINGILTQNFTYNHSTKQVNFYTNLVEGANIIQVKGVNEVGQDSETTTIVYVKPETPKPPIVTFIDPGIDPIVVYSSTYNVTAKVQHVDGASDITLKINGVVSTNFTYSASSDMMNFTTGLAPGSNVIEITGTNDVGQDIEATTIIYKKTIPQAPPVVDITYVPQDNQLFATPNITVVASVLNVASSNNITVWVNGNATTNFTYNTSTKILNLPLTLVEGSNTVKITGTNNAGTDTDTRIIIHKLPAVPTPPTVEFVNPASSPFLVSQSEFTVTATTTNIDDKNQITFKMNGNLIPDAQYTFTSNHQIIYNADLENGNNIFEVFVTNQDGSDADMTIITYEVEDEPCIIPTVGYIHPVPYSTVNDPNVTIDAQINNHSPGTTVQLVLNGVSQGYMTYNSSTSTASKAAVLSEGSNSVKVIVTNSCGTNQATFTLNYVAPEAPCEDPVLSAISPTNTTTQDENISLNASVSNVTAQANITVQVNGSATAFTYDQASGGISINNAALSIGNNTITVTATNDCGAAVLNFYVNREPCNLPAISNISATNGSTVQNSNLSFAATIANANQQEIILLFNGISQPFSFNNQTGLLSAALNLNEGGNQISIQVTNSCGTSDENLTVNYEVPCEEITTSRIAPANETATVTSEAYQITLHAEGSIESNNITVSQNGNSIPFTFDPVTEVITIAGITLVDGANAFVVNINNDCSNATVNYNITYNGCQPPTIAIPSLSNGMTVNNNILALHATVTNSNGAGNIVLNVNNTNTSFDFNEQTGNLTSDITLNEGANTITLTVNGCETASQTITVNYVIPCEPISFNLMQPANTAATVTESDYAITVNAVGLDNQNQITVTQNGTAIPFNFDANNHIINVTGITLVEGANAIVVTMTNNCSTETITYNITYNGCQPPVITLGNNAPNVETATYNFTATVTNIADQQNLQVLVNNAPVSFVFNANTGVINAEVTLNEGNNSISIVANGCESASKNFTVNYTIPCEPITYTLGTPAANQVSVADPTYSMNLVAQHVHQNDISVTLNGATVPFTFNNNIITINGLTLVDGSNTVVVTLSNLCSSEEITYTITHDACATPVINLGANLDAVSTPGYNFTATLDNVENQNQIVFTVNGSSAPFTFDQNTGLLTATTTLNEGNNTIAIQINGCETASANFTVNYTIPCIPVTYTLASPTQLNTTVEGETTSISLNVENVSSNNDISASLNGTNTPFTFANNMITLNNINLNEGANVVVITISNACSNETITYNINSDQCDSPVISVANNNIVTEEALYTFTCNVSNITSGADITVTVNGTAVTSNYEPNSGVLTAQMSLNEGANEVKVTANGCETVSITYTITYQIPCDPITYTLNTPSNLTSTVNLPAFLIKLSASNIESGDISVTLNGQSINHTYLAGLITVNNINLQEGTNTIVVNMSNDCSNETVTYTVNYEIPCEPITFTLINPTELVYETPVDEVHLTLTVLHVNEAQISVTMNGEPKDFTYNSGSHLLTIPDVGLEDGENTVQVTLTNNCSSETITYEIEYSECEPTVISVANNATQVTESTYNFNFNLTNIPNLSQFSITHNGNTISNINFDPVSGAATGTVELTEGENTFIINGNGCEPTSETFIVNYNAPEPEPCGPRFNPGNSEWQFCLVTPSGTYNRDDLANNNNFTYSGPATAAYFKPIAGGGDAIVNGQPYQVQNGQYYLFEGNLTVDVSSQHPGSMGHWEICIQADNTPQFGNGNNRPASPCEAAPCDAPEITITSSVSSSEANYNLAATVTNVQNGNAIQVKLNGQAVPANYNNGSNALTATLTLVEGTNTIEIIAEGCETTTKTHTVNYTVTSQEPDFEIEPDGGVTVNNESCVNIKCLGESVVYNNSQEAYVVVDFSVNGGQNWYAFNNENYVNGGENIDVAVPANGEVALRAHCVNANGNWSNTEISNNGSQYVYVLKNGDQAPTYDPASGQQSLDAFLAGYIDANGIVTIGPNDVIYLFELRFVGNYGIDYQDCVMLVTFDEGGNCPQPSNPVANNRNSGQVYAKPVIKAQSPATTTSQVTTETLNFQVQIENVNEKADVKLYLNNAEITNFNFDDQTGLVSTTMTLQSGSNTIKVDATNGNKNTNTTFTVTNKGQATSTPTPSITKVSPSASTQAVDKITYSFKAKVDNVNSSSDITLKVNGVAVTNFAYNTATKEVTAEIRLREGANSVQLSAKNGEKTVNENYSITYSPPAAVYEQPVITNVNPANTSASVTSNSYTFKAKVTNVQSQNDISLKLNGTDVTNVAYNRSSREVSATVRLNEGANSIVLKATNGDKSETRTYTITYAQAEVPKPTITNVNPSSTNGNTDSPSYTFKAQLTNVRSSNDISLKLNGSAITNFTFDAGSKILSAVLRLREGVNSIVLTATNGDKSETRTYNVTYTPKVEPKPVITNISPASTTDNVDSPAYTFKASVTNVRSKDDISMTLNGSAVTNFTYSSSSKQVSAVLRLGEGNNSVVITASNGQSETRTYTINYTPKVLPKPVITNVSPSGSTASSSTATYNFKAKVSNVSSKNDIKVYVNGKTVTGFTFSTSTGQITAVLRLNQGANTVKVVATNGDQSTSQTWTITYTPKSNPTNTNGGSKGNSGNSGETKGGGTNTNSNGGTKGGGTNTNSNGGTKGGGTNSNGGSSTKGGGTNTNTTKGGGTTTKGGGTNTNNNNTNSTKGGGTTTKGGGSTNTTKGGGTTSRKGG